MLQDFKGAEPDEALRAEGPRGAGPSGSQYPGSSGPIMIPNSPESAPPAPELASYQRKALRGLANPLRPVVHVGEAGVSDAVLRALDEALLAHELVKVRLFAPEDKKATGSN